MTAVTGTGSMKYNASKAERFNDFSIADSNLEGAFAYLDWNFALFVSHVTLLHADYVNTDNSFVYLHWGFELPTWSDAHSAHATDVRA